MKLQFIFLAFIIFLFVGSCSDAGSAGSKTEYDICIYGSNASGVIAAYTAAKMNKKVILVDPGRRLGGLTSGGLGYTDIGNKFAISGLALDFYRRVGTHYGKLEQWIFEPSVAENILKEYIRSANITVMFEHQLEKVDKNEGVILSADFSTKEGTKKISAKMFLDCTYEGDLMAMAKVSYIVGREDNKQYGETYNGVQLLNQHQFPDGIDPYKVPGDENSGLLWGISDAALDSNGTGDKKVQAYNFRICLSDDPANMIPITRPGNYDSSKYELLLRLLDKKPVGDLWGFMKFDLMPNHKTDINNNKGFSTDMIGMNYDYPEADPATRKKIQKDHEDYTKGFLYFVGNDPRMPAHLREQMKKWGYPKDEYTEFNNWSPQMYVREARRMVGQYVMTQANCEGREVAKDAIGMAAYTMDSHNCQRIVVNGMVKNEGNVEIGGFPPYPISYGSIIPKESECKNLLVPVCLSASHIAYGSIRMEPVFMVLGQSAAVAASLAIDANSSVQKVDISSLQKLLKSNPLVDGSTPEIIVDNEDMEQVKFEGTWEAKKNTGFGASAMVASKDASAVARFIPQIKSKGEYEVFVYMLPKFKDQSQKVSITINNGKQQKETPVHLRELVALGQTSGEWIALGKYSFEPGSGVEVNISNKDADGFVLADAVLFKPVN